MRLLTRTITPAAVVTACLFCFSIADAKKPVTPPGGGGGGGDSSFQLVELQPAGSTVSAANAISDSGIVVGTVDGTLVATVGFKWW